MPSPPLIRGKAFRNSHMSPRLYHRSIIPPNMESLTESKSNINSSLSQLTEPTAHYGDQQEQKQLQKHHKRKDQIICSPSEQREISPTDTNDARLYIARRARKLFGIKRHVATRRNSASPVVQNRQQQSEKSRISLTGSNHSVSSVSTYTSSTTERTQQNSPSRQEHEFDFATNNSKPPLLQGTSQARESSRQAPDFQSTASIALQPQMTVCLPKNFSEPRCDANPTVTITSSPNNLARSSSSSDITSIREELSSQSAGTFLSGSCRLMRTNTVSSPTPHREALLSIRNLSDTLFAGVIAKQKSLEVQLLS